VKPRFRSFACIGRHSASAAGLGEDQLGVEPVDLGFLVTLTGRRDQRLALVEQLACLGEAAGPRPGGGEVGEMGTSPEARAGGVQRPEALLQVGHASLELASLDERPAAKREAAGHPERQAVLGRIGNHGPWTEDPDSEPHAGALIPAVPLIDREREVEELRAALDAALGGSGRVVLLGGEPGIGKTRLATVLAGEAESRGVPVWWGRGWEDGSAPAFWPWNTALRRWIDQVGHDAVAAAAGSWGAELAHVFSVLRERMPELPPSASWESDGARFRLFGLVSRFLGAVAKPAGLVVVLDDVHWADRPSLKLLEFIAAELTETRLLVVATYRDTEVQQEDPLFGTLSRIARAPSTRRLLVRGLSPADCARWIALTGAQGDAAALGEALHRETNGNPFFVSELIHLLADEDDLGTGWAAPRVPHGVRELIARRLDRLGDDCRATLAVAALFGDTIDAGMPHPAGPCRAPRRFSRRRRRAGSTSTPRRSGTGAP
jgi:AAA ATPase domain